jgi:hypothetical protein
LQNEEEYESISSKDLQQNERDYESISLNICFKIKKNMKIIHQKIF